MADPLIGGYLTVRGVGQPGPSNADTPTRATFFYEATKPATRTCAEVTRCLAADGWTALLFPLTIIVQGGASWVIRQAGIHSPMDGSGTGMASSGPLQVSRRCDVESFGRASQTGTRWRDWL